MGRLLGSLLLVSVAAGSAFAQSEGAPSEGTVTVGKPPPGVKLAQAECQALWQKANPSKKPKISTGQAQAFITDVKAASSNGDGSIDQNEFLAACDKGLMKSSASGGSASTGSSGAEGAGTAGSGPAKPGE